MRYTLEERKEIISAKPSNVNVETYCKTVGIAYPTYYKWKKELNAVETDLNIVDVTSLLSKNETNTIDLEISDITIHVNSDYNEAHLLSIIKSIKKL